MISRMKLTILLVASAAILSAGVASAEPLVLRASATTFRIDPATLRIDVTDAVGTATVMPPLHAAEPVTPVADGAGWRWIDAEGRTVTVGIENQALHLTITATKGLSLAWDLPAVQRGTWLVPDGEGMAYRADDPFWRKAYARQHCEDTEAALSFPAWSYMTDSRAVTYALGDGLKSALCLHDADGLQGQLTHEFADGTQVLDLILAVGPADPLAPAHLYRELLQSRGQFKSFADKAVPKLERLFGAPQAYVWGDGRDPGFLDDLKALGIQRIALTYDWNAKADSLNAGPAWLARADALGYLAGPYDIFEAAVPDTNDDEPYVHWGKDLYPSGCVHDAEGAVVPGYGGRGCQLSSEAVARHAGTPSPASRYAAHVADGADQVFLDSDGFGEFFDDTSPDHPMTMARDRANRLARMKLAIDRFHLVLGSENVTAWAAGVTHYSHGTAQARAHNGAFWKLLNDPRFTGWWPPQRPSIFFKPFQPTADEARDLFGPVDRLPLFEAVFHDSVVAADRWEFGLMKVAGMERSRFARSLLYGTPTMWNLDRKELARVGPWLKAAHDDFRTAHGWGPPVALTGFKWLSDDRTVQQTTFADGRVLVANFGTTAWRGLGPDCVRLSRVGQPDIDMCPPADPAPFK